MKVFTKAACIGLTMWMSVSAQQTTDYLIIDAPIGTQSSSKVLWVKWAGISRGLPYPAPDSGTIYFDRSPGGGKLSNYRYSVSKFYNDTAVATKDSIQNNIYFPPTVTTKIARRGSAFRAADQPNMGYGVFYCVVALPLANDTLVSNEFQLMIESPNAVDWIGPSGTVSSVTPTFQWNVNSGVPYYHLILSDDIIKIDSSSGTVNLQGLSIIWQAITPSNQIIYGAPDPSRTITADPPPLSPGQRYTWVVLNNYGNHPAFSSTKIKLPPGEFSITGTMLNKPVCVFPIDTTLDTEMNPKVTFKWKNLDKNANTYKLYIYVGSEFEQINAQLIVYQTEIVASGKEGADQYDSVEIEASAILTSNKYVWRMIAVNDEGAGTVGDTVGFNYTASIGELQINTREQIVVGTESKYDTVINPVGLVQIKVEVLEGSLEAPLLFYTDNNGYLKRDRPTGTYRLTAIKNEFEQQTKTVVVKKGETTTETFFLERPDATVYGKVLDDAGKGINLAAVYGVSDRGDSVKTKTDALGSFILNCYAADWRIGIDMTGYESALPKKITVQSAENHDFGTVNLKKNPFTLSGTVKNSSGASLLGVRVRLFKDGVQINELPSTPQNGTFSFTVPTGTYMVAAEKTGFSSYNKSIDIVSSRSIVISLEPGAALITGYIYGLTWVNGRDVIAPITNAKIKFTQDATTDTQQVISDATYGDFRISLPGEKKFTMVSSAEGYVALHGPLSFTTVPKSTQSINDTLQGLGMVSGNVILATNGLAVGGVTVNLIDVANNAVAATGKTAINGAFELRKIPDGTFAIIAAKEGLVIDSIAGSDSVVIQKGKAEPPFIRIYVKPGDKMITWHAEATSATRISIKMQSPLVKTMGIGDSMKNAGPGSYIVSADVSDDSVIDLAYHHFEVKDTETVHDEKLYLGICHVPADTLTPENGKVTLVLTSASLLDSVIFYYRDAVATNYLHTDIRLQDTMYTFTVIPPRDGSTMLYYFKAFRGNDVYGYDKENFSSYIAPDLKTISRFEIVPSSDDALVLAASYEASFECKTYVSSSFMESYKLPENALQWTMENAQGCKLNASGSVSISVTTGKDKTTTNVRLTVTIDTSVVPLLPGVSNKKSVDIMVTGAPIKTINVLRTDAGNPNPITTSSTDNAEFSATGTDENGEALTIRPAWSISPEDAGRITGDGVFWPAKNFAGTVRIFATVGEVTGEYRINEQVAPGLGVRFMIVNKSTADSVNSRTGCVVVFPPNVVGKEEIGLLEITVAPLRNQFKRSSGILRVIDTAAFEIRQLENISFDLHSDSIRLRLAVPEKIREDARNGSKKIFIAQWIEDSLLWKKMDNSKLSGDGAFVSAGLTHFSRYSIVYEPSDKLLMDIAPNPFSPFIVPHYNPFNSDDRVQQHPGACIRVQADVQENRTDIKIAIYTLVGDRVWSMILQNADNLPYYIWWDGRTSVREIQPNGTDHVVVKKGDALCRNGRYFAMLTAKVNGKEQRIMKQIILMK